MAKRKEGLSFLITRFKGFLEQYKQSKRGMLGIGIIIFFGIIAIFAPVLSPLDPLAPRMEGHYPAQQPKMCEKLCVPIWYKSILGMTDLSENLLLYEDHEFVSEELFYDQFDWEFSPDSAQPHLTLQYKPEGGEHNDDGCVELTYMRGINETRPIGNKVVIRLRRTFEYPYGTEPVSIWWHRSLKLINRTKITKTFPINITFQYYRGNETDPLFVNFKQWSFGYINNRWFSQTGTTLEVTDLPKQIFSKSGNYTAEFVISIEDFDETADYTLYIDNFQVIHYGKAFGYLGTSSVPKGSPRDLFTMLVHGTRISFMIGILTAVFSVLIGLFVGLAAGYLRGLVDEGLMRFADFLLVLPGLPLLIVLVTVLGRSIWNIIGVLVFMGWMGFSRTVRSMVLSLRERPFIESAKASGGGSGYIIYRHILPNVFALVYISLATAVPGAIISEASLAWLGLGDINIPSWGIMLYDFSSTQTSIVRGIGEYWFWVIPPGIAIALLAMAFILMGFALDEILNPKLRQRR